MIYALTSSKWEGEVRLEFHENGQLKSATLPEVFDAKSLMFFSSNFPVHVSFIPFYKEYTQARITEVATPIDFDDFWNAYDRKSGNKDKARDLWEGLKPTYNKRPINGADRQDIMSMLKRYTARYRGEKKDFQPIPTTFLNQRYWVSEMESAPKRNEAVSQMAKDLVGKMAERINSNKQ